MSVACPLQWYVFSPTRGSKPGSATHHMETCIGATRTCSRWYEWISTNEADEASHTHLTVFHHVNSSVIDSWFVHHVFSIWNCPLHEHVLSVLRVKLLLFRGRAVLSPSGWPPSDLSERIVHVAGESNIYQFQWHAASYVPKAQTAFHA